MARSLRATFVSGLVAAVSVICATISPAAVRSVAIPPATEATEEIVVTAQRSGIPVWRVTGPRTTLVLVGSIGRVAPGTQWDPASLDRALTKADRVMFPETLTVGLGLFSLIGILGKWRKQAKLKDGQTLQSIATPAQWARLVALRERGILKPGFERSHPYHLAAMLKGMVRDRRKRLPGADAYVRRFVGNNKGKLVPLARANSKDVTSELFGSQPREHMACLMDSVALVEAGPGGVQARTRAFDARSQAWAARRVPAALAARMDDGNEHCWPEGGKLDIAREASLGPTVLGLLSRPEVTLAVLSLDSLAARGGILDKLTAAGFDVSGPRWRD